MSACPTFGSAALPCQVYCGCGNSFDAALDTLSELLGAASEPQPPHSAAALSSCPAPPGSAPTDPTASSSAAGTAAHGPGSAAAPSTHQPTTNWGDLPEEVKEVVLGMLPIIDVARAAATCREFARRVKLGAVNAKVLTIPTGAAGGRVCVGVGCRRSRGRLTLRPREVLGCAHGACNRTFARERRGPR